MQYFLSSKALLTRSFMSSVNLIIEILSSQVFESLVEAVQNRRVVDENFFPCGLVRREQCQQIDEIAVVWRVARREIIRVRPIGAPDGSIRRRGDDSLGVGNHLDKRQTEIAVDCRIANLVGAADLYPDVLQLEKVEQQVKAGLTQALRWSYPRDVVDHYGKRHTADAVFLGNQVFHVDVEIHRPAQFRDVFHAAVENVQFDIAARTVEQIEANTADAALM